MSKNYKDITRLSDTISIPVTESFSPMVSLNTKILKVEYKKDDMKLILGNRVLVREEIANKLYRIQNKLNDLNSNLLLFIVYGYRSPDIQKKYYEQRLEEIEIKNTSLSQKEKIELAHSRSANPESAGHICGAAIDVTLFNEKNNKDIDMGSNIGEFGDIAFTFYPKLSAEQKNNRLLLHELMLEEEFAPFLGEWWHFSYGDKEWAFYYKKPFAIYDVVETDKLFV